MSCAVKAQDCMDYYAGFVKFASYKNSDINPGTVEYMEKP